MTAALSAQTAGAATRQLYLAATDGWVYMPDEGDGAGTPRKVWIRGFVADTAPGACAHSTHPGGNPPPAAFFYLPTAGNATGNPGNPCNSKLQGMATLPAPIIDVDLGDDVFITLSNVGNSQNVAPDPHTIHLHGLKSTTQNDGFNETAWMVPIGYMATYYFKAERAGSFMYHCHVEASEHVQMGMYGAMIIRPTAYTGAVPAVTAALLSKNYPVRTNTVFGGGYDDQFDNGPDGKPQEYIHLLSEIDPVWHEGVLNNFQNTSTEGPGGVNHCNGKFEKPNNQGGVSDCIDLSRFNPSDFKPGYWLLNGRSFPDTLAPVVPLATHLANGGARPGDGPPSGELAGSNNLVTYRTFVDVKMGDKGAAPGTGPRFMTRVIGMGFTHNAQHWHGFLFRAVGEEASPVPLVQQHYQDTLNIASGQTFDLIIAPDCLAGFGLDSTMSQSPGTIGATAAGAVGASLWPGVAELAATPVPPANLGVLPIGQQLSVQVWPVHSHYDYTVTNYGAYPGGALQLIRASNAACK